MRKIEELPPVTVSTINETIKILEENQPGFRTAASSKMSVNVDMKGREMTVGATCSIVSDSAIHLSIMPFMGIELFKLELNTQGFVLIDKMNKRFYENTYAYFKNHFGLDINFHTIQSLISNRLFIAEKRAYLTEDFEWKNNDYTTLTLLSEGEKTIQETTIDRQLLNRIAQLVIQAKENEYQLVTNYSTFKKSDNLLFPEKISITLNSKKEKKASFDFEIGKIEFNQPLTLKTTNLSRYTRGDLNALFKK
ncbi:MAG: DUF4292 domain-containing protein [Paludibacteraceae bacterium]